MTTILPEKQALLDAGIDPQFVQDFIGGALGEHLMDEVRCLMESGYDHIDLDDLEDKGIDARELIANYVRETIVIGFDDSVV